MSELSNNNVLSYPTMTRQRADKIQAKEIAYAEDVNAEFDHIVDVYNRLVSLLTGEWGDDTGRIYDLIDNAVSLANEALAKANDCVQKSGDTMTGHLSISLVPSSDYHVVNKKYVDDTIQAELSDPVNRISELEKFRDNLNASQVKLENANFSSTNVNDGMNELFISVSNGKKTVADAITGKGVATSGDASFKQMADNINAILTFNEGTAGGTATAADIMYGKTAYARGSLIVGSFVPFDTMDATATAADIREGKTAYANGQKIYGTLIYTKENNYEINPDNPYPQKAEVELVYGEKEGEVTITKTKHNDYDVYDISSDNRLLIAYDETDNKIKTFLRGVNVFGEEAFVQQKNQHGVLLTPEYTFEDLKINGIENYKLSKIKFSIMNANQTVSGYECRVAFLFIHNTETTVEEETAKVFIFRISTYDGKIKTMNENTPIGNGSTTYYNRWECSQGSSKRDDTYSAVDLIWSPFSYKLAVACRDKGVVYDFKDTYPGDEDFSKAVKNLLSFTTTSTSLAYDTSYSYATFANNDRIFNVINTASYSGTRYLHTTYVLDTDFNVLKRYSSGVYSSDASKINTPFAFSNDGLYMIGRDGNIYSCTINYVTGEITTQLLIQTGISSIVSAIFSYDSKFIIITNTTETKIISVNYSDKQVSILYNYDDDYIINKISNLKSFEIVDTQEIIKTIVDGKELIGVKYQGQTFYNNIYNKSRYTATQEDVKAGKTFIGFNGIPETGTMGGVTND